MNKRSQRILRTHATQLPAIDVPYEHPEPFTMARLLAEHNNDQYGTKLDFTGWWYQGPDHRWWEVAWTYDTRDMTEPGGDVVMCWWQETSCPSCMGERSIPIHDNRDGVISHHPCPETHPEPPPAPEPEPAAHLSGCDGTCDYGYPDGCPPF